MGPDLCQRGQKNIKNTNHSKSQYKKKIKKTLNLTICFPHK